MPVWQSICSLSLIAASFAGTSEATVPSQCTATGDLEIRDFTSRIFHNTRKLRILLPAEYRSEQSAHLRYPVLYLNDGQNLFDVCTSVFGPREWQVDETTTRLIAEGRVAPLIVVGIDNAGKHTQSRLQVEATEGSRPNEYLPFPDDSLKPPLQDVHGSDYPAFLTREVMPFIEKNYRVRTGPENTGLGGSSYGGLVTFYVALHTNHVFGRLLIESPSLYVKDHAVLKEAVHHKVWPARIYFGAGAEESPPDAIETVTGDINMAATILQADGVAANRILVNITPGQHDEDAWAARFPTALAFLFPARAKARR
jgi:predicted alpha/beta superfamily hydrolase